MINTFSFVSFPQAVASELSTNINIEKLLYEPINC